jgi:hypothetical protein
MSNERKHQTPEEKVANSEARVGSHSSTACSQLVKKLANPKQRNRAPFLPERHTNCVCSAFSVAQFPPLPKLV